MEFLSVTDYRRCESAYEKELRFSDLVYCFHAERQLGSKSAHNTVYAPFQKRGTEFIHPAQNHFCWRSPRKLVFCEAV